MQSGVEVQRYGTVAKVLHWLTFVLLLGSFGIGLTMVDMPIGPRMLEMYAWHKWAGVTVFLVTILRVGWRCANPPPPLPDSTPRWQRLTALLSHAALYVLLLVMPISGWVMSSALGLPTVYFGLITLPDLLAPSRELGESLVHVHHALGFVLAIVIGIHIGAAAYHHFVLRDGIARQMFSFRGATRSDRV